MFQCMCVCVCVCLCVCVLVYADVCVWVFCCLGYNFELVFTEILM